MHDLRLDAPRAAYCRQIARKALRACASEFAQGWPVDIRRAVQLVLPGFVVIDLETLPDGVSAIVDMHGRSIGVNARIPLPRQRLSIAHEVGHVLMDHPTFALSPSQKQNAILEMEANIFASEFLVPLAALKLEFRKCRDYTVLADTFRVDRETMYYRFRDTRLLAQVL